jgi:hypothetical protein
MIKMHITLTIIKIMIINEAGRWVVAAFFLALLQATTECVATTDYYYRQRLSPTS